VEAPKCRLLLVDDCEDDALLIRFAFGKVGRADSLFWLPGGRHAIDYLSGKGLYADRDKFPFPDVMLLDVNMPEIDGYDVLKWVRGDARFRSLPVVMFATSPLLKHIELAYDLGANSYLTKPTEFRRFTKTLVETANFWLDCCRLPSSAKR
jgi:two-component system response regulator